MLKEVEKYLDENYPEEDYRCTLAEEECGDINVVYIHHLDHNFLRSCRVLYYNKWYPNEFTIYKLMVSEEI